MKIIASQSTLRSLRASVKRAKGSLLTTCTTITRMIKTVTRIIRTKLTTQKHLILALCCRLQEKQDNKGGHLEKLKADQLDLWSFFIRVFLPQQMCTCSCPPGFLPTDKCPDVSLRVNPPIPLQINPRPHSCFRGRGGVGCPIVGHHSTPASSPFVFGRYLGPTYRFIFDHGSLEMGKPSMLCDLCFPFPGADMYI